MDAGAFMVVAVCVYVVTFLGMVALMIKEYNEFGG